MVIRAVPTNRPPMVKVYALKGHVQRNITHRPTGYKFTADGSAMWPMDQFTKRRLRDGDISLERPDTPAQEQAGRGQQQRKIEPPRKEA